MRTKLILRRPSFVVILLCSSLLLTFVVGCGGSGDSRDISGMSIEEVWQKAEEADAAIDSFHMEIAFYYENTQFGGGQTQSMIVDVNGEDLHEQDLILGQVYFEYKRVGGQQYVKDVESGAWEVVTTDIPTEDASEFTSQFLQLLSLSTSQERVGTETLDEEQAEHFLFSLDPDGVIKLFTSKPSYDFSGNTGGEVNVWIDSNAYYLVRYELVIHNVVIPEIGNADLRFVVSIRDINEPIEIIPPV
jgi:outer membrane lipoprotein-sorting protein